MKKALSLILTLVLSFGVFAGISASAYNTEPYAIPFEMSGYKYNASAAEFKLWIDNELFVISDIAVDMRYHLEDADGVVEEGNIRARVNYRLVCELMLAEGVTTDGIVKERLSLHQESSYYDIHASDFYYDGEWFVIVFDLPVLAEVIEAIDFYMEGYEIGMHVDDIVVYTDNELVKNCRANFYMSKNSGSPTVRETGKIKGNINYSVSVLFEIPDDYTVPYGFKIRLNLPDGSSYGSRNTLRTDEYYSASYQLVRIKTPGTNIMDIKFVASGYEYGKKADDLTVTTETTGITISSVSVKKPVGRLSEVNYEEFHGYFDSYIEYQVEVYAEVAEGYILYDDLPGGWVLMDIGKSRGRYMSYYPSGDGYIFTVTVQRLLNPNLEQKTGANFSIIGYALDADIGDIRVTVDDEEIEINNVDIIDAAGTECTGSIREGIQYQVAITVFAPGGWNVSKDTVANYTINTGEFAGVGITTLDERILTFRFKLPVFGELIDDPDDPGNGQYDKLSSLELALTGYELGNDVKNVGVICDNEAAVIRRVSVNTPDGKAYDGPIEAGVRYQVTVTVFGRGGWQLNGETFSDFKLDGVSPCATGIETGYSDTFSFVYYVYALAASNDVNTIGDMDCDGEVTVSDALRTLRIAAKLDVAVTPKSTRSAILGDADRDGEITVSDALIVLRKAAGLA
ncbi:MAG: hypothetical protein J5756_04740 [Clostridia bacterium]|nr:hypothetical protein [Clostridia bacterium]